VGTAEQAQLVGEVRVGDDTGGLAPVGGPASPVGHASEGT
jgi:hypothetical protein